MLWQTTSRILPTPPPRPPPPAAAAVPAPAPTPTTTTTTTTATPTTCVYLKKTWRLGDSLLVSGCKGALECVFLASVSHSGVWASSQTGINDPNYLKARTTCGNMLVGWLVGRLVAYATDFTPLSLSIAICWHCWASKTTSCQPLQSHPKTKPSFKADPLIIITPS